MCNCNPDQCCDVIEDWDWDTAYPTISTSWVPVVVTSFVQNSK